MNYKKFIIELDENKRRCFFIKKHHLDIYIEIENFIVDNNLIIINFSQKCYHYVNDLKEIKKCKICGKEVKFINFNRGYRDFCSSKCVMCDNNIIKKRNDKSKKTNIEKYGVDNYSKTEEFKDKSKKTNIEKYGVDSYSKTKEFKDKMINNNLKKYNTEYYFQSKDCKNKTTKYSLEKYGLKHYNMSEEVRNKRKITNIKKYGSEESLSSDIIKNKISDTNLQKYGETCYMTYMKNNNLSKMMFTGYTFDYYSNFNNIDYSLERVNDNFLYLNHKKCCKTFEIQKQLFYLRNKNKQELCTFCNTTNGKNISCGEKVLLDFIISNTEYDIIQNSRKIIYPYEIDIYIPELKLAFEFNGLWWHCEINKSMNYHKDKADKCDKNNIELIQIWEDDWLNKNKQIKEYIIRKITKNKIEIKEYLITDNLNIKDVDNFISDKSIMNINTSIKIGCIFENKLIAVMLINDNHILDFLIDSNINENIDIEIINYYIKKYTITKLSYKMNRCLQNKLSNLVKYKNVLNTDPNYVFLDEKRKTKLKNVKIFDAGDTIFDIDF